MRARDSQHPLRLPGRRRSHTLRVHHEGPRQSHALLPRILRADDGKYLFFFFTERVENRGKIFLARALLLSIYNLRGISKNPSSNELLKKNTGIYLQNVFIAI